MTEEYERGYRDALRDVGMDQPEDEMQLPGVDDWARRMEKVERTWGRRP